MNTIEHAWNAFMAAINEAHALNERGASAIELAELTRHTRELLDILEDELAVQSIPIPAVAGRVLAQLRGRLESLEKDIVHPARALVG